MSTRVNINGKILAANDARISVFDHGFLFGDAIYETVRTYHGRPFLLSQHFERLEEAAESLGLEIPLSLEEMNREVDRTLQAAANEPDSLIRLIVTRGEGEVNPDPDTCGAPSWIVFVLPLVERPAEHYREGVGIVISALRRDPEIASIKTGNLIHQVLGAREAKQHGAVEAIFLNAANQLSDGTRSNIYLVRGQEVLTPSERSGIVRGITRGMVLEVARGAGIPIVEGRIIPDLIEDSDEIFITSTTQGIMPVTRVNGRPVGTGKVGPLTRRLSEAYRQAVEELIAEGRAG